MSETTVRRRVQEESGFTLPEMMVTMVVMIVVLFALYSIFDMSIRIFSFGNDKTEAVENARLGMQKMEREIRAAYRVDKAAGTPAGNTRFTTRTATQIGFGNDLDGNRKIECPATAPPACETINYQVYETPANSGSYALGRANSAAGTLQPVVEYVDYVSATNTGLSFSYFKADGVTPANGESDTAVVRIQLRIRVPNEPQDGTQTLTTDVHVRNS